MKEHGATAVRVVGILLGLLVCALIWKTCGEAQGAGIKVFSDSSKTSSWGLIVPISTEGTALKIDSVHAHSKRDGVGDNAVSVSRRSAATSGDADSAWIGRVVYAGDTTYIFRDVLSDWIEIDTGPTPDTGYTGYYEMIVKLFADGQPTETHFEFQWIRSGYPPVNVVHIEGADATTQMDAEGTSPAELAADVDTNMADLTTQLAADVDTNMADLTTQLAADVDTNMADLTTQLAADVDTNMADLTTQLAADVDTNMAQMLTANEEPLDANVKEWNGTTAGRDSIVAAAIRAFKALPDKQPCNVEAGGVLVTDAVIPSYVGGIYIGSDGWPLVDTWRIESLDPTDLLNSTGTSAVELAARTPIGDTNQFNIGDTLTQILSGNCGTSNKNVVFYVIDTSGVDDTLPNANVYMLNSGQTAVSGNGVTGGVGVVTIGLNESTTYNSIVRVPGYNFPAASVTTTAGASPDTVDLEGYNLVSLSTPASHMTTLTGNTSMHGSVMDYCEVRIKLVGATAFYTSTSTHPYGELIVHSDGSGDWSATVVGTDSLNAYLPEGSNQATYCVEYLCPEIQNSGGFRACELEIPANGSTTELKDLLD